jgi:hypothetical protein
VEVRLVRGLSGVRRIVFGGIESFPEVVLVVVVMVVVVVVVVVVVAIVVSSAH